MCKRDDTRRILLALFASDCPQATLFRAQSLSLVLGAELHVLRVVPPITPRPYLLRRTADVAEVRSVLARLLEARRRTWTCLGDALGDRLPRGRLKLRSGDFFVQTAARASELSASLIVLAPEAASRRYGRKVTRLARSTGAPVLVARDAGLREAIVAATDLRTKSVPVLRTAAELSERLGAPLVAVHNLTPELMAVGPDMAVQLALPAQLQVSSQRRRLLAELSQDLPVDSEAVMTSAIDPVQAVLAEARARDADLIVVGTRGRSWLEHLVMGSVSATIVSHARRSVLVTPLTTLTANRAVASKPDREPLPLDARVAPRTSRAFS